MLRERFIVQCKGCNELRTVASRYVAKDAFCIKCANAQKTINRFRVCKKCGDVKKTKTEAESLAVLCKKCRIEEKQSKPLVRYYHFCPICSSVNVVKGKNRSNFCVKHAKKANIHNKYTFDFSTMQTVETNSILRAKVKYTRVRIKVIKEKVKRIRKPKKTILKVGIDGRNKVVLGRIKKEKKVERSDAELIAEFLLKHKVKQYNNKGELI